MLRKGEGGPIDLMQAEIVCTLYRVLEEGEGLFYPHDEKAIEFIIEHFVKCEPLFLDIIEYSEANQKAIAAYIRNSEILGWPELDRARQLISRWQSDAIPDAFSSVTFFGLRHRVFHQPVS